LYTGVTNNLKRRLYEHKREESFHFTKRYNITKLVYFEKYGRIADAIQREKQIKAGSRKKKEEFINTINPQWSDLSKIVSELQRHSKTRSWQ